jgi:glycosyltransferase involved in cell wall biosynthesis
VDVTVIIPVYNAAGTLENTLKSVAAQTMQPARIIIADDQSPDNSAQVALATGMPNIEVVTLPQNGGCGAARNYGAQYATTELLAFLDADDEWAPTFLEEVTRAMAEKGADFGSSGGLRKLDYHDKPQISKRLLKAPAESIDLTDDFWKVALRFRPIHPSSLVVRRDIYERVGGFCGVVRNGEDTPLYAELWRNGKFVFVNKPLFTSIAPPSGLSAKGIAYSDVRISLGRIGRSVWRALTARRRGSGWFAAWWLYAIIRRNGLWVANRLRRRVASGPAQKASARA